MAYFKFPIPRNSDGSIATYSPGWHGEMSQCPKDVEVLLYNDSEGFGVAKTEDTEALAGCVKRGEAEIVEETEALGVVENADYTDEKVYKAVKLEERWLPVVEEAKASLDSEVGVNFG
jgi:hypothetical protein